MMNDEVLLSGDRGVYCRVDISPFLASSSIDFKKIEREFFIIGFNLLGNIFCSSFSGLFVRGYAQSKGRAYASLVMRLEGQHLSLISVDFYTMFGGGASLTTSVVPGLGDSEEKKIYRTSSVSSEIRAIYREHEQRIKILAKEHGEPCSVENSLYAMAVSVDEFLTREAG